MNHITKISILKSVLNITVAILFLCNVITWWWFAIVLVAIELLNVPYLLRQRNGK